MKSTLDIKDISAKVCNDLNSSGVAISQEVVQIILQSGLTNIRSAISNGDRFSDLSIGGTIYIKSRGVSRSIVKDAQTTVKGVFDLDYGIKESIRSRINSDSEFADKFK